MTDTEVTASSELRVKVTVRRAATEAAAGVAAAGLAQPGPGAGGSARPGPAAAAARAQA